MPAMPRKARHSVGGVVYHVLNRSNGRRRIFSREGDYLAFLKALLEACAAVPGVRVLSWCVMPTHFHLVLWPRADGELSAFMRRLTQAHAQRWRVAHNTVGDGSLYQGRFKSFPVQVRGTGAAHSAAADHHFLVVCSYVERNAVRARLVRRARDWRWCSAWVRSAPSGSTEWADDLRAILHEPWPVDRPLNWDDLLDRPQDEADEERVRHSVRRGAPFGEREWAERTAKKLGIEHTLRPPGRPRKRPEKGAATNK